MKITITFVGKSQQLFLEEAQFASPEYTPLMIVINEYQIDGDYVQTHYYPVSCIYKMVVYEKQ